MLLQDVHYALRSLLKNPGLTLAVLLLLALGIGASTAMFSVTDAIVLRPLPYPQADRLVFFYQTFLDGEVESSSSVAYQDYLEWKERSRSFDDIAASAAWMRLNMTGGERPERVHVNFVSSSYFEILGTGAARGRGFLPAEDGPFSGPVVAVLSDGFWKRNFGGDPGVLGKTISLNGQPVTVVGVLPEDFHDLARQSEVYIPVAAAERLLGPGYLDNRPNRWLHPIGRLKPGVSLEQADAEMDALAASLAEQFPENKDIGVRFEPVSRIVFDFVDLRTPTLAMMLAAALLLLICCINVANLLILRSAQRGREIALRLALGATYGRLARQLTAEGLLLAAAGGALGLLLGYLGTRVLVRLSALDLPGFTAIAVNGRVVAAAALVSLLTGLVFGLLPALRSRPAHLRDALQQGALQASGGPRREAGRRLLIVAEVALALVLLLNAGLMIRSFGELRTDHVGMDGDDLLLLRMDLDAGRYPPGEARRIFAAELARQARALSGVAAAGLWGPGIPGTEANFGMEILPEVSETAGAPRDARYVRRHHVTPGALRDLGITLRQGRDLAPTDAEGQPLAAVVSETLARELWPGQDPLGKRFGPPQPPGATPVWITVVGVAADVRHGGRTWEAREPFSRDVYLSLDQAPERQLTLWVRGQGDAAALGPAVRALVQSIDPNLPVFDLATMAERRYEEEAQYRFRALLVGLFGTVALILTSAGLYTVLAFAVAQRTREIGIRSALGAQPREVLSLVMTQGLLLVAAGAAIGLAGAAAGRRLVASLLYGITPGDPATWAAILAVLGTVALIAVYLPARRALRVDPVAALRYE